MPTTFLSPAFDSGTFILSITALSSPQSKDGSYQLHLGWPSDALRIEHATRLPRLRVWRLDYYTKPHPLVHYKYTTEVLFLFRHIIITHYLLINKMCIKAMNKKNCMDCTDFLALSHEFFLNIFCQDIIGKNCSQFTAEKTNCSFTNRLLAHNDLWEYSFNRTLKHNKWQ